MNCFSKLNILAAVLLANGMVSGMDITDDTYGSRIDKEFYDKLIETKNAWLKPSVFLFFLFYGNF
jgi:hypothetical protein